MIGFPMPLQGLFFHAPIFESVRSSVSINTPHTLIECVSQALIKGGRSH